MSAPAAPPMTTANVSHPGKATPGVGNRRRQHMNSAHRPRGGSTSRRRMAAAVARLAAVASRELSCQLFDRIVDASARDLGVGRSGPFARLDDDVELVPITYARSEQGRRRWAHDVQSGGPIVDPHAGPPAAAHEVDDAGRDGGAHAVAGRRRQDLGDRMRRAVRLEISRTQPGGTLPVIGPLEDVSTDVSPCPMDRVRSGDRSPRPLLRVPVGIRHQDTLSDIGDVDRAKAPRVDQAAT
jgi:hypothetical protein